MLSRVGATQLLVSATLLSLGGLVMVYSASALNAELRFGSSWVYAVRQFGGLVLGVGVALILSRLPLALVQRLAYFGLALCVVALLATLTPLGSEQNGLFQRLELF